MKTYRYKTKGTCSSSLNFTLEDGKVRGVSFTDGCRGNLLAISKLVEGMPAERVVQLLRGNPCGGKATSCADQLTMAVESALRENPA